ncbi:unnamed protein product [Clonostachys byssicola]|uniref:alcohol O-acetyltransferase n=1 Tax=Clonostachys byssicola TaxID=160290 RepID=A0A9N9UHP3_9HYPO|nr:unnamed protein product [Clonostachys byssicola]
MDWLGRAKIRFTHAASPLKLERRDGESTDLLQVCEQSIPPCNLNPLLFNGHLQTLWATVRQDAPPIYYKRRVFEADNRKYHGTFAVDFVVNPFAEVDNFLPPRTVFYTDDEFQAVGSDDTKPQLIVLHGMTGGSYEPYLRHCIALLREGWSICVVNSRGCAGSKITSEVLYNARATWDFRQVVAWFKLKFPNRPLFGLGFSLGANMLTNYCGEEGERCLLKAAVVCSNPFNLEVVSRALLRTYIGKFAYLRAMGETVKEFTQNNEREIKLYTDIDYDLIMNITTLTEFDTEVHCKTWGYPTVFSYYRDASSSDSVLAIKIPFLALHAVDDPIAVDEAIPYEEFSKNPHTILCTTSLGGHLGWFEPNGDRWHAKAVRNFLNKFAFDIEFDHKSQDSDYRMKSSKESMSFDPMRRKVNT